MNSVDLHVKKVLSIFLWQESVGLGVNHYPIVLVLWSSILCIHQSYILGSTLCEVMDD